MPSLRTCTPLLLFSAFSLFVSSARAEDSQLVAYRAACIVVAPGESREPGILLVRGDRVVAVLAGSEDVPRGAEVVDLGELHVLPGLVNPLSAMSPQSYRGSAGGIARTAAGGQPGDGRKRLAGSSLQTAGPFLRRLGAVGYAAFGWLPSSSGFIAGQAAALRPATDEDASPSSLVLKEPAFILMSYELGESWRETAERELKKAADAVVKERAEAQKKAKEGTKPSEKPPEGGGPAPVPTPEPKNAPAPSEKAAQPQKPPEPPDPLVLAFRGEIPIFLRVLSPAALDHFFRVFDRLSIKPSLVLVGSDLPPETVAKLVKRKEELRAFILEPRVTQVRETSVLSSTARLLSEAGRDVAFVPLSDSLSGHEEIFLFLAESIRCGLNERDALAAVTTVPARLLGLEGRVGVLRSGASASFAAYDGDPLSGTARLRRVFVEGTEVFREEPETLGVSGVAVR